MTSIFPRPHLNSEIPCSVRLRLPGEGSVQRNAAIMVDLLIAPMLTVGISFHFQSGVEQTGGPTIDDAVLNVVRRWITRNRDVLLAVVAGEYDLAREILDIDLEELQTLIAGSSRMPISASDHVVAEAVARNLTGRPVQEAFMDQIALRREMGRRSAIAKHRRQSLLAGVVPRVLF